jgi:methyl-accepting chemotaxis protein
MWEFLGKLLEFMTAGYKLELRNLAEQTAGLTNKIIQLEETIMSSKEALQGMADQIGNLRQQIADSITNISTDIQNLTGKLANAMTPQEVQDILQPQLDALQALATAAKSTADIVPDTPADPGTGEL